MAKFKILITVKTYPTLSTKYDELVCTAGLLEDGTWIRIYPIQFRKKSFDEQYKKYDWIEIDLVRNKRDFRKESYRPVSYDTPIKIIGHLDTRRDWLLRKEIVFKSKIYDDFKQLIAEAKDKSIMTSLAVFRPTKIVDFKIKEVEREWDKKKLGQIRQLRATNLFSMENEDLFDIVRKLPYKFSYLIADTKGNESNMMIEDWEIGQLYWRCLAKHEGNEAKAVDDVRKKYYDDFAKTKDLYLFLGTSKLHHFTSKNPFMVIGTFHPKREIQTSIFSPYP